MLVEIVKENNNIVYHVTGRITSDTYTELVNAFVPDKENYGSFYLDLSSLEYISSAGLRAILGEEKKLMALGKHLIIRGCSSATMEVFKICGFDQILKFEESLPIVDVSKMEVIGQGLCGSVYKVSDDTILKLYNLGYSMSMIENEKKFAREALIAGVPTAISLGFVKSQDGRLGILFEMINAKSLKNVIANDFEHIEEYMKKYVELIKTVHNAHGNEEVLPHCLDNQIKYARRADWLNEEEHKKIEYVLSTCDRGTTCIHGDFHAGNVMYSNGEMIFIDMGDFGIGSPYQDLAHVYNLLKNAVSEEFNEMMTNLTLEQRHIMYDYFVKYYFNNPTKEELEQYEKEMYKYQVIKHFFYIENFETTRQKNIEFVKNYLKTIKL
uniref:STAS domain-containing protein n=1 Tax=uncultured bacterium fosmid pJB84G2 TaxID=1478072 RepID=A0A0H3UA01_9BACT|nr:hypothetical protein [uncultured bacterium fosmid pJB84G2]